MNKLIEELVMIYEDLRDHIKQEPMDGVIIAAMLFGVLTVAIYVL